MGGAVVVVASVFCLAGLVLPDYVFVPLIIVTGVFALRRIWRG